MTPHFMTDQRGALVIASPDGRFRFVDPLHHTYAKAALQSSGRGQARTYYLDTSLAFDSAVVFTQLLVIGTPGYLAVAEAWAIGCEALFYWAAFRGLPVRRAIVVSLAANAVSFAVGLLITAVWPGWAL